MEEKIETKEEQIQEPKRKKMDPNDKKIIFCSLAILGLVIVPLVLAKALEKHEQKYEDILLPSYRLSRHCEDILVDALEDSGIENEYPIVRIITYTDNYPENFSLSIVGHSVSGKVYTYELENYSYPKNKKTSLEKYLLSKDFNKEFFAKDAAYEINTYDLVRNIQISSEHKTNSYVIGQNASNEQYLFGYYKEVEDVIFIYNKVLLEEGNDPFLKNETASVDKNEQEALYYFYCTRFY